MDTVECVVVGAGVVGLAVARRLAQDGADVLLLEAHGAVGEETSSRNSEVIHAGLYYAPGSLKARLCVAGREAMYTFADTHGVQVRKCGKLVVATEPDEIAALETLKANAEQCGAHDLEWLTGDQARALEPNVNAHGALLSPSTGIIDSHGFMLALLGDLEDAGGQVAYWSRATGGRTDGTTGHELSVASADGDTFTLGCRTLINAAGLGAQGLARSLSGTPQDLIPPLHYCKGNHFTMGGKAPFSRLIYPAPGKASLGLHFTLDLGGQARFGPDVEWVDQIDYVVDPARADSFYAAIRRYYPALADGVLDPAYSGIRPKIQAPGEPPTDFRIAGPEDHGIGGLVQLFGIESPGLTSSLAIADHVAALLA
ncbi:MAG: NAD(P)/FAD-dependent oxidoreductase [Rhodospirillales bacterium]|nr:NAD(P)/FAD-dependent oxidoreductase [Rhodospirillales bacterium]